MYVKQRDSLSMELLNERMLDENTLVSSFDLGQMLWGIGHEDFLRIQIVEADSGEELRTTKFYRLQQVLNGKRLSQQARLSVASSLGHIFHLIKNVSMYCI